jgi:hypothetical protein|uniref:Uncharacterized protein n=2 Tax=Picea TaxID=3328 RepID=A0A101M003_PICGL|nr:hypothetical protein ABT39_MTgene4544 [Picea glauca]QHR92732.1 hypothetical protein Q903MT_gene6780 [Picea sitchensis]
MNSPYFPIRPITHPHSTSILAFYQSTSLPFTPAAHHSRRILPLSPARINASPVRHSIRINAFIPQSVLPSPHYPLPGHSRIPQYAIQAPSLNPYYPVTLPSRPLSLFPLHLTIRYTGYYTHPLSTSTFRLTITQRWAAPLLILRGHEERSPHLGTEMDLIFLEELHFKASP